MMRMRWFLHGPFRVGYWIFCLLGIAAVLWLIMRMTNNLEGWRQ
jgi:hypothetical protein